MDALTLWLNAFSTVELLPWIALFIVLELLVLLGFWFYFRRGVAPLAVVANVGAGACLFGALWTSIAQWSQVFIVVLLLLSLCFHVIDLRSRWQS
jgi:hypothetical protein